NFNYDRLNFVKVGVAEAISSVSFVAGVWQHAVVTWDAATSQVKFYRNGVLAQTVTSTPPITVPTDQDDLVLGRWLTGGNHFNGVIDEVQIYSRALTQPEIQQLYDLPNVDTPPSTPTNVTASVETSTRATVNWSAST